MKRPGRSERRSRVILGWRIRNKVLKIYWSQQCGLFRRIRDSGAIRRRSVALPDGVIPFVVLTSPRTGSNLLMERLNSQWSCVRAMGEALGRRNRGFRTWSDIVHRIYFDETAHRIVGCKVHAFQISDDELQDLLAISGMRVVLLRRRNIVRKFVSFMIAAKDGVWLQHQHTMRDDVAQRAIHVDVAALLAFRDETDAQFHRFESAARDLACYRLDYEDLVSNLSQEVQRVADFLSAGAPDSPHPSPIRQQNPEPLHMLISNFDELRHALTACGETQLVADLDG